MPRPLEKVLNMCASKTVGFLLKRTEEQMSVDAGRPSSVHLFSLLEMKIIRKGK